MEMLQTLATLPPWMIIAGLFVVAMPIGGWVLTTWMRIKNGYPLDGSWGQALHPKVTTEERERIKILTGENAQLRAELGSVRDRVATIERIVTDSSGTLARQIDDLTDEKIN